MIDIWLDLVLNNKENIKNMISDKNVRKHKIIGSFLNMQFNNDNGYILFKNEHGEDILLKNVKNNDLCVYFIRDKSYEIEYLEVDGSNYLLSVKTEENKHNISNDIKEYALSKIMSAYHFEDKKMFYSILFFSFFLFSSFIFENSLLLTSSIIGLFLSTLYYINRKENSSNKIVTKLFS